MWRIVLPASHFPLTSLPSTATFSYSYVVWLREGRSAPPRTSMTNRGPRLPTSWQRCDAGPQRAPATQGWQKRCRSNRHGAPPQEAHPQAADACPDQEAQARTRPRRTPARRAHGPRLRRVRHLPRERALPRLERGARRRRDPRRHPGSARRLRVRDPGCIRCDRRPDARPQRARRPASLPHRSRGARPRRRARARDRARRRGRPRPPARLRLAARRDGSHDPRRDRDRDWRPPAHGRLGRCARAALRTRRSPRRWSRTASRSRAAHVRARAAACDRDPPPERREAGRRGERFPRRRRRDAGAPAAPRPGARRRARARHTEPLRRPAERSPGVPAARPQRPPNRPARRRPVGEGERADRRRPRRDPRALRRPGDHLRPERRAARNPLLTSIRLRATPDEVRMILIDPKRIELNHYESIPHLLTPVVSSPKGAAAVLANVVGEMERRYERLSAVRARNLPEANRALRSRGEEELPYLLVVIDELADLMMISPQEVEDAVIRLAQKSRAVGIHLVLATQRPSVDVITGMIKANVPSRIAFAVSSQTDSRVILDQAGAESLLGQGDMLFKPLGTSRLQRVQGAYVSEEEIALIVDQCRHQRDQELDESLLELPEVFAEDVDGDDGEFDPDEDALLEKAIEVVIQTQTASVSLLQRRLRVGYTRAGRLIDMLERRGIISGYEGSKPRRVLVSESEQIVS